VKLSKEEARPEAIGKRFKGFKTKHLKEARKGTSDPFVITTRRQRYRSQYSTVDNFYDSFVRCRDRISVLHY
jgi:hypothetical protein